MNDMMRKHKCYNYFDGFMELINFSCECAENLFDTLIHFDPGTLDEKLKELHAIEHAGDSAKHEMMKQLACEFIAPIEREDIITLAQCIDDITDAIEDVLILIHMFNVKAIKPEVLEFTALIDQCCQALRSALEEFHNYKKSTILHEKIVEVNDLEEVADRFYYNTVHNLYLTSSDPVELLIWTRIYDNLEKCCDTCESAANIIESVAMKNS